jgi:Fe-S cluster biogenesis protein NfuA
MKTLAMKNRFQEIEAMIMRIRSMVDPETRDAALELVQTVMELHATAIDRMMEIAASSGDTGWRIIDLFSLDDLVANLLVLHGLHPLDMETRVRNALEKVSPYVRSHCGNVELINIAGGTVRLRLIGNCNESPSSRSTLKNAIEKAIYQMAPDVTSIHCEAETELPLIPLR